MEPWNGNSLHPNDVDFQKFIMIFTNIDKDFFFFSIQQSIKITRIARNEGSMLSVSSKWIPSLIQINKLK